MAKLDFSAGIDKVFGALDSKLLATSPASCATTIASTPSFGQFSIKPSRPENSPKSHFRVRFFLYKN